MLLISENISPPFTNVFKEISKILLPHSPTIWSLTWRPLIYVDSAGNLSCCHIMAEWHLYSHASNHCLTKVIFSQLKNHHFCALSATFYVHRNSHITAQWQL